MNKNGIALSADVIRNHTHTSHIKQINGKNNNVNQNHNINENKSTKTQMQAHQITVLKCFHNPPTIEQN